MEAKVGSLYHGTALDSVGSLLFRMQHEARQSSDGKLRNILFSEVSGLQLGAPQKSGGAAVKLPMLPNNGLGRVKMG